MWISLLCGWGNDRGAGQGYLCGSWQYVLMGIQGRGSFLVQAQRMRSRPLWVMKT